MFTNNYKYDKLFEKQTEIGEKMNSTRKKIYFILLVLIIILMFYISDSYTVAYEHVRLLSIDNENNHILVAYILEDEVLLDFIINVPKSIVYRGNYSTFDVKDKDLYEILEINKMYIIKYDYFDFLFLNFFGKKLIMIEEKP
ncbi:hypothetical protein [Bacillus horti]|uniref:Uncharacterized protein n=1 Tax=Caldalkalibacillus horti TaxID=77523 RepID=A0ABT9W438_9BACI|nr:hypothetical protein [Bacillus horti]MDQ0168003.1 hypothetical protein [Bacillus horti]